MAVNDLVNKLRSLMKPGAARSSLNARSLDRLRLQLQECAAGQGGEVSARTRAARLAETYLGLNDEGRQQFLKLIAHDFGPDPARVAEAHAAYQKAVGTDDQWKAEAALREFYGTTGAIVFSGSVMMLGVGSSRLGELRRELALTLRPSLGGVVLRGRF